MYIMLRTLTRESVCAFLGNVKVGAIHARIPLPLPPKKNKQKKNNINITLILQKQ